MAVSDTIAFLRERMQVFDPTLEVGDGSDFYQKVLLPLADRLGADPFTTNVRAFLRDILQRNFPDYAFGSLDALAEALIVPAEAILQPVVDEITRLNRSSSLSRPDELTIEEAENLGANLLEERERGDVSRGLARIYFTQPRSVTVNATNLVRTASGLEYYPTTTQSISASDMLFNTEGSLYYFAFNVTAAAPGRQYDLEPHELVSITGIPGVVKVTNPARFRGGVDEQTAEEFVDSLPERVSERSMSAPTGIVGVISKAFPAFTRLAVIGHGDEEMQRDVLEGASMGTLLAAGFYGRSLSDNEGRPTTRRFQVDTVLDGAQEFSQWVGSSLVLTVVAPAFAPMKAVDIPVRKVLSDSVLDLEESKLALGLTNLYWTLRRREILLKKIPGGIDLPNGQGFLSVPTTEIHVGGAYDVYARAAVFADSGTIINTVQDASPLFRGFQASATGSSVVLGDLALGVDYTAGSEEQDRVRSIIPERWALQLVGGTSPGVYEILSVVEDAAGLQITLYDPVPVPVADGRWKIVDRINLDLLSPKEFLWDGSDLECTQASDLVTTSSLFPFSSAGVEPGDVLEIFSGEDRGTYSVVDLVLPGQTKLKLSRPLTRTASGVRYSVYRESTGQILETPVVKIESVEVLDSSGQPLGVKVSYGACLGGRSLGLTNPGVGIKLQVPDALLGIISNRFPSGAGVSGKVLKLLIDGIGEYSITFVGANPISVNNLAQQINTTTGLPLAVVVGDRLGILPYQGREVRVTGSTGIFTTALPILFGGVYGISTTSIRSPSFSTTTFTTLSPALSLDYDVVELRDGGQIGAFSIRSTTARTTGIGVLLQDNAIQAVHPEGGFFPEAEVRLDLGSRSLGVVRLYFQDPVSFEVGPQTVLTHTTSSGAELRYKTDPRFSATILPALPSGAKPKDGNCLGGDAVLNTNVDFLLKKIRPGDVVVVDYKPIVGAVLPDPVPNLALTTVSFSFGTESSVVHTFVNDTTAIPATSVSRQGVLDQLNRLLGAGVASLGPGNELELNPEYLLIVGRSGTANTTLGFSTVTETNNRSSNAGRYRVAIPGNLGCILETSLANAETRMQFSVIREGAQRMGATTMSTSLGEAGLYVMDVEVVSEGTGNLYNLAEGESLEVDGFFSDGYLLSTPDSLYSFTSKDRVNISFPRSCNAIGTNDDPEEATPLTGQQLQVTVQAAPEIAQLQQFVDSDGQRDVNASPLALALTPNFVRFDLDYTDGPEPGDLRPVLETLVHALFPDQDLGVDDIIAKVRQEGASSVSSPLTLFTVEVSRDRKLRLKVTQDRIVADKRSAYYPSYLNLRRQA